MCHKQTPPPLRFERSKSTKSYSWFIQIGSRYTYTNFARAVQPSHSPWLDTTAEEAHDHNSMSRVVNFSHWGQKCSAR